MLESREYSGRVFQYGDSAQSMGFSRWRPDMNVGRIRNDFNSEYIYCGHNVFEYIIYQPEMDYYGYVI